MSASYFNNMGGWKIKFNNSKEVWRWCIDCYIILSSAYIAVVENLTADRLSGDRNIDKEWRLYTDDLGRFLIYLVCPILTCWHQK